MAEKIVDRLNREQVVRLVLDQMREADHWTVAQTVLDALERWDGLPPDDIGARRAFLTELHPGSDATVVTRAEQRPWTPERIRGLGMTTDLETAAEILGIGRTLAYELVKNDEFPVGLLRLGRRVVISIPELLRFLGSG